MKRTVLAGKARLNYAALIRYLKFLRRLKWVDFTSDSGSLISITNIGRSFQKLLEKEDSPPDLSEEVLERLLTVSQEENIVKNKGKDTGRASRLSCLFCGKPIKARPITKEIEGETFSFDKRECATLFMKFRHLYGKEFLQ